MLYSDNKKQLFIEKWKYAETEPRLQLVNGVVIGTEVDKNNYLYYVIKRGSQLLIERANKHRPIANFIKPQGGNTTITFS